MDPGKRWRKAWLVAGAGAGPGRARASHAPLAPRGPMPRRATARGRRPRPPPERRVTSTLCGPTGWGATASARRDAEHRRRGGRGCPLRAGHVHVPSPPSHASIFTASSPTTASGTTAVLRRAETTTLRAPEGGGYTTGAFVGPGCSTEWGLDRVRPLLGPLRSLEVQGREPRHVQKKGDEVMDLASSGWRREGEEVLRLGHSTTPHPYEPPPFARATRAEYSRDRLTDHVVGGSCRG